MKKDMFNNQENTVHDTGSVGGGVFKTATSKSKVIYYAIGIVIIAAIVLTVYFI